MVPIMEGRCQPSRAQGFPLEGASYGSLLLCSAPADHELTNHNRILPTDFGGEATPQPQLQQMAPEACLLLEETFSVSVTLTFVQGYCPCIQLGCFFNEGLLSRGQFCRAWLCTEGS